MIPKCFKISFILALCVHEIYSDYFYNGQRVYPAEISQQVNSRSSNDPIPHIKEHKTHPHWGKQSHTIDRAVLKATYEKRHGLNPSRPIDSPSESVEADRIVNVATNKLDTSTADPGHHLWKGKAAVSNTQKSVLLMLFFLPITGLVVALGYPCVRCIRALRRRKQETTVTSPAFFDDVSVTSELYKSLTAIDELELKESGAEGDQLRDKLERWMCYDVQDLEQLESNSAEIVQCTDVQEIDKTVAIPGCAGDTAKSATSFVLNEIEDSPIKPSTAFKFHKSKAWALRKPGSSESRKIKVSSSKDAVVWRDAAKSCLVVPFHEKAMGYASEVISKNTNLKKFPNSPISSYSG